MPFILEMTGDIHHESMPVEITLYLCTDDKHVRIKEKGKKGNRTSTSLSSEMLKDFAFLPNLPLFSTSYMHIKTNTNEKP